MTRQDQELLDKQLQWLHPTPRKDGTLILIIVMIFLAGMFLGALVQKSDRQTSTGVKTAIFVPKGTEGSRLLNSNSLNRFFRGDFGVAVSAA